MKKIAEQVILIAQICISVVFVLTVVLCMSGAINQTDLQDNKVIIMLFAIIAILYAVLSAWLIYAAFSERVNIKRVLLFYDPETSTWANAKVVTDIINGCAKEIKDVKVRKIMLRIGDKQELTAIIHLETSVDDIAACVDNLRILLAENLKSALGLTFASINFEIDKLNKKFKANTDCLTPTDTSLNEDKELPPRY